jgi:hypothetical protein
MGGSQARRYTMKETVEVANEGTRDITEFLLSLPWIFEVVNVEDDPYYQSIDVDLLVVSGSDVEQIEIKADRYYHTGNYFFETDSNKERGTLGCFMYTEADKLYYYFVKQKELHILPMPLTREWFVSNKHRFEEKSVSTSVGKKYYTTCGYIVPRDVVQKEVGGVVVLDISNVVII